MKINRFCPFCKDYYFQNLKEISQHIWVKHAQEKGSGRCQICQIEVDSVRDHIKCQHLGIEDPKVRCPYCLKRVPDIQQHLNQMVIPIRCQFCPVTVRKSSCLKRHIYTFHKCQGCNESSSRINHGFCVICQLKFVPQVKIFKIDDENEDMKPRIGEIHSKCFNCKKRKTAGTCGLCVSCASSMSPIIKLNSRHEMTKKSPVNISLSKNSHRPKCLNCKKEKSPGLNQLCEACNQVMSPFIQLNSEDRNVEKILKSNISLTTTKKEDLVEKSNVIHKDSEPIKMDKPLVTEHLLNKSANLLKSEKNSTPEPERTTKSSPEMPLVKINSKKIREGCETKSSINMKINNDSRSILLPLTKSSKRRASLPIANPSKINRVEENQDHSIFSNGNEMICNKSTDSVDVLKTVQNVAVK